MVTLHGAVVSPGRLHGKPTTRNQGGVVWTGKTVDVKGTYHAPDTCQVKILPLVDSCADPLVLGRKGLKNDVLVPLARHWLAHVLQTLAKAVHGLQKIVGTIACFDLGTVELFMVSPPSLFCVSVVLLVQGTPCCLPVTDPILPGFAHVRVYDVVGRTLRDEEQDAQEVVVPALPRCHGRSILCGCRRRIALENGGNALPIEQPDDAKPVFVFQKLGLIFAVKAWAEIQYCLDAVGIMSRHDTVPVVEYQTRTVELTPLLEACPTFLQAAMHCVECETRTVAVPSLLKVTYPTLLQVARHCVYCETRTVTVPSLMSVTCPTLLQAAIHCV